MAGWLTGWGLDLVAGVQHWRSGPADGVATLLHHAGHETGYLLLLPLIYWCVNRPLGRRLLVVFLGSVWLNARLKQLCHLPRPWMVSSRVHALVTEGGSGLPSGHVQFSTAVLGLAAVTARQARVWGAVVAFVALVGWSRLYLGLHYPQDVLAGFACGALTAAVAARWLAGAEAWLARQDLGVQLLVVTAVPAGLACAAVVRPGFDPAASQGLWSALGTLLGVGLGFVAEARWVRFEPATTAARQASCYLLGLVVLVALRLVTGVLAAHLGADEAMRVARYAVLGLWVAAGAPAAFVGLGWAGRRPTVETTES